MVEKADSGKYLAHTILPLDWAYKNARMVCRPDSNWLIPNRIKVETNEDKDIDN